MTLSYLLSGYLVIGLSTDTKPTDSPNGAIFTEYDTNKIYTKNGATWTLSVAAAGGTYNPVGAETLGNKTIPTDTNIIKHSTTNLLGDLLVNSGTKFDRLAKGTANQVLAVSADGTTLTWATVATGGIAYSPTATEVLQNKTINDDQNAIKDSVTNALGDILKNNATKFVRFPKGTASQVLHVKADGTDLEWYTLPNPSGTWDPTATETLTNKTMNYNANTFNGFVNLPSYGKKVGIWNCTSANGGFEGYFQGLFTSSLNVTHHYGQTDGNYCRLENPVTNGGSSYMRTGSASTDLFCSLDSNPYLKIKVKTKTVVGTRQHYGFTDNLAITSYNYDDFLKNTNGVMFGLTSDALPITWVIQHNNGSTSSASDSLTPSHTPANDDMLTLEIRGVSASGKWQYRYNANSWVDITTQIPVSGTPMGIAFMNEQNTTAGTRYADIYYVESIIDQ